MIRFLIGKTTRVPFADLRPKLVSTWSLIFAEIAAFVLTESPQQSQISTFRWKYWLNEMPTPDYLWSPMKRVASTLAARNFERWKWWITFRRLRARRTIAFSQFRSNRQVSGITGFVAKARKPCVDCEATNKSFLNRIRWLDKFRRASYFHDSIVRFNSRLVVNKKHSVNILRDAGQRSPVKWNAARGVDRTNDIYVRWVRSIMRRHRIRFYGTAKYACKDLIWTKLQPTKASWEIHVCFWGAPSGFSRPQIVDVNHKAFNLHTTKKCDWCEFLWSGR